MSESDMAGVRPKGLTPADEEAFALLEGGEAYKIVLRATGAST